MTLEPPPRVGILGGGQLAMMLCEAAGAIDLETVVLTPDTQSAAALSATRMIYASLDDETAVAELIASSDVITYELEDIPTDTLTALTHAVVEGRTEVFPRPKTLAILQNKGLQKNWLRTNDLATAPFYTLTGEPSADQAIARELALPLVQKAERGGYDGRGVQVLRSEQDLDKLWPVASFLEPFVEHELELAVVVARSTSGELRCFQPVHLIFDGDDNILDTVTSPADVSEQVAFDAVELATRAITALDDAGVFAVELFLTTSGELLINEISPRVHNAGHLTIEASNVSQFELHLRAVTGMPLPETRNLHAAVMKNVLFSEPLQGLCDREAMIISNPAGDIVTHWYGKKGSKPKRKMGHITALSDNPAMAAAKAEEGLLRLIELAQEGAA